MTKTEQMMELKYGRPVVHLQGIGDVPAKHGCEVVVGDELEYNYGYVYVVTAVKDVSPSYIEVTEVSKKDGHPYQRRIKKDRLVAYAKDARPLAE